jgi:hypothetical protein
MERKKTLEINVSLAHVHIDEGVVLSAGMSE